MPTRLNPSISRRKMLALTGSITASYLLGGCGGGDGASDGGNGEGLARTVLTGDLKNQINQFSLASEQITNIWEGSSTALANLNSFANGGLRSPSDTKLMIQATWYALQGLKAGYERLANGLLAEDDQGYVAHTISTNYSFSQTSTLVNPQWLAAMMQQTYCALRLIGSLMKIVQVGGIKPMQDWVKAQPTDLEKLIAYGILADTYNSWLDAISDSLKIAPLTELKLDVSNAVTAAQVGGRVDGMDASILKIPFTPGNRAGGNANGIPDDAMLIGPEPDNFALSFLGTLAKIALTTGTVAATFPQTVDPASATYNLASRLGTTGLAANIATQESASVVQTKTAMLIRQLTDTGLSLADGSSASCHVRIAIGAYNVVTSVAQAVLSEHSIAGAALDGAKAVSNLQAEVDVIGICGSAVQKALLDTDCVSVLNRSNLIGGSTMVLRSIATVNLSDSTETDQIRGILEIDPFNTLSYPPPNAGWNGSARSGSIPLFRAIIAGLPSPATGVPRTFSNIEVAAAGLVVDLVFRYSAALRPDLLTDGRVIFIASNFARILRRSPGATFAMIPNITSAALLCSAPGFSPSKTSPVNLSSLASLGQLKQITDFVPGVPLNVN